MSTITQPVQTPAKRKAADPTTVNVTRNEALREYLEERKALKAAVRAGEKAAKVIKQMDAELIYPLLQGEKRYLVVNGQRVMRRTENPVVRDGVDLDLLKQAFPDAYEVTAKPSVFHTLTAL